MFQLPLLTLVPWARPYAGFSGPPPWRIPIHVQHAGPQRACHWLDEMSSHHCLLPCGRTFGTHPTHQAEAAYPAQPSESAGSPLRLSATAFGSQESTWGLGAHCQLVPGTPGPLKEAAMSGGRQDAARMPLALEARGMLLPEDQDLPASAETACHRARGASTPLGLSAAGLALGDGGCSGLLSSLSLS